jgi:TPR repeat protein
MERLKDLTLDLPLKLVQRVAAWLAAFYGPQGTLHRKLAVSLSIIGFSLIGLGLIGLMFLVTPLATLVLLVLWLIAVVAFTLGYRFTVPHGGMDFPETYSRTLHRAGQGEAEAILALAAIYRRGGHGLPATPGEAVWWLSKAAADGSPEAAFELGGYFERGEGVLRNLRTALSWYERAADGGIANAAACADRLRRAGPNLIEEQS